MSRTTGAVALLDSDKDEQPDEKTPAGWARFWQKELAAAQKRLAKFTKSGNAIVRRYLDERDGGNDSSYTEGFRGDSPSKLNLFHTNVSTLQSMLYGSTPKIDVTREHHDPDDDIARVAGTLFQRILETDVQSSGDDLSTVLKATLQDRLLPGIGTARITYEVNTSKQEQLDPVTMEVNEAEVLDSEEAKPQYVHWQDFTWGWARTWTEIPWVGFRAWLTKTEATERFGAKKAGQLEYINQLPTGSTNKDETYDTEQKNNVQKAEIWEFWQKSDRKVFWYSSGLDLLLDMADDPLELEGFFPCPMPMIANLTTTLFVPRADFAISQDLYNEIDELQSRVSTITRAIKVVGVYDKSETGSVGRMLKEGVENDMIPVDNWAMFAEKGGLKGSIDWFPVNDVVGVLQTLIGVRDQTIELLYQVTGMSDILRGANTDQYTSDGTNQLKAKFGSIRVQALQDDFARFASDLDSLKAEVISKHFEVATIAAQSSAAFMPQADQPLIQPALELMKSAELRWRVNIRPESIAMVDYAQLKAERIEFLMAMSQYIQSAQAMAAQVPESMPIMLEMLKWGMSGFKGANYLEGTMDAAIELAKKMPPAGQDDGQAEAQAEQQRAQMEMQRIQMEHKNELEKIQAKAQSDMQTQQQKAQTQMQQEQTDHQNKMAEEQTQHQNEMQKLTEEFKADMILIKENLNADVTVEQAQSSFAMAEEELQHENTMTEKADGPTNESE